MQYIFDTSAINQLHDDPHRTSLIEKLHARGQVVLAGLNVIEAAVTENCDRRVSLLRLQQELAKGERPLRVPTQIIQSLSAAYSRGFATADIAISNEEGAQLWWILHEPEKIDEEVRQEGLIWKAKLEDAFDKVHRTAREAMRKLFSPSPKSFGQTLQFLCRHPAAFLSTASMLYEESGGTTLTENSMRELFRAVPEWPLYLAGWAQGMYARAIQNHNSSPRKNAGTIDLWFAVHLAHCNALVTHDRAQYRALRVINAIGERRGARARVLSYDGLRASLLEEPQGAQI